MDSKLPPQDPSNRFEFSYQMPPAGAVPITAEEAEKRLLQEVREGMEKGNALDPTWRLAHFYKQIGRIEKATGIFRELLAKAPDPEQKAQVIMALGQTAEKANDFELAVRFYSEAIGMEPCRQFTWYYIHNNLGYSLNQLGRFSEGEVYCRRAIEISPIPCNAHKNLGLALQGQGKYAEAAECFVRATQANASDPRSTIHLEQLLKDHPELQFDCGHLLEKCKAAVREAHKQIAQRMKPVPPKQTNT